MKCPLSWLEISKKNLKNNIKTLRDLIANKVAFCAVIKANAYGHGLKECAPIIAEAGTDFFGVNSLDEAVMLRKIGINEPIYIMGYVPVKELSAVVEEGFHMVVYNAETVKTLEKICAKLHKPVFTHLKLETGTCRQGILDSQLKIFLDFYKKNPLIRFTGLSMHFANIEDTVDHSYAIYQLNNFIGALKKIQSASFAPQYIHAANTAATMLFSKTHFTMVRIGIGIYGLWPSNETYLSVLQSGKKIDLKPIMAWKTIIAQIKKVPAGSYVGYGCTYKTTCDSRLAVLPVGYYDGYDRGLTNLGYVLIRGLRAPIRGRVFMNMLVVDITHIPEAQIEDEVVLMGKQGNETLTADQIGSWLGTINYEVVTRINKNMARKIVD